MSTNGKPVWFITGCSTGIGRELARHVLSLGYRAVVTARNPAQVEDLVKGREATALALKLDVTNSAEVAAAVNSALDRFGRIDVLVNNAGIGYFGAFEESDLAEVHRIFEINFWGLTGVTRAVLPGMRKQRSGTIVNLSSIGGLQAYPSLSFYNATKFAVEALSESLSQEVAPLGIKVLIVEPSGFRTDFAGRSANEAPHSIEDYSTTATARAQTIRAGSGKQAGDPVRAAAAIVKAVEAPNPPLRLLLGKAALAGARKKMDDLRRDLEAWEAVSAGADFPG